MDKNFNTIYHPLATDLINDIFYVQGLSHRGQIGLIRQYTEMVVRSLLRVPFAERLTLGDNKTSRALGTLKAKGEHHYELATAVEFIRDVGNAATHTLYTGELTEKHVKQALFHLAQIYAYQFVEYFHRHRFGSNPAALVLFALLPPRFRLMVLIRLHRQFPTSYEIAEKMIILLFKVRGVEKMNCWIARNQHKLEKIARFMAEDETAARALVEQEYSAYDFALAQMGANIHPAPYQGFDVAAERYREYVSEMSVLQSPEIVELKGIMDFVYLGTR